MYYKGQDDNLLYLPFFFHLPIQSTIWNSVFFIRISHFNTIQTFNAATFSNFWSLDVIRPRTLSSFHFGNLLQYDKLVETAVILWLALNVIENIREKYT